MSWGSEWCEVPWALGESMSGGVAPGQGAPTLNALITLVLLDFIGAYGIALGAISAQGVHEPGFRVDHGAISAQGVQGQSPSGRSGVQALRPPRSTQARLAAGSANHRSASKSCDTEASRSSGEVCAAANTARASSRYVGSTSTPAHAMWRG